MSDLQCAARFVVVPAGDAQVLERLRGERPAAVHAAPGTRDAAGLVAGPLAVPFRDLSAEAATFDDVLSELADEYRGECAAVVVTPAALADLARRHAPAAGDGGLVVEIDADGRRWAPWPVSAARGR